MRVLVVGRSRRRDIERRIHLALRRAGHVSTLVDDRRLLHTLGRRAADAWLEARVRLFRPERVILGKPVGISPGAVAALRERAPTVMWYRDLTIPPDPAILARARHADTVFLTAAGQAEEFEAAGVRRALFLPDGADPELDRPVAPDPAWDCDVAFVGTRDAFRAEVLSRITRRFRLRTWGRGWRDGGEDVGWMGRPAYHEDFGRVCASARIVLGLERSFQMEARVRNYSSNRMWRVIGAGGFYLGFRAPGLDRLLLDGRHCAFYDGIEDTLAKIQQYLDDADARERIRAAGRAFVMAHHTLDHRLHNLLAEAPFENPLECGEGAA